MSLAEKYDWLWAEAAPRLRAGTYEVDHPPVDGEPRWGLSLVALPTGSLLEALSGAARDVRRLQVGDQHVHDPAAIHLTITSLEPYRSRVPTADVEPYGEALNRVQHLLDFSVEVVGLGGSAAGVFAQGFGDAKLQTLRAAMHQTVAEVHGGQTPETVFIRDTAHVSLSVFRDAAHPPQPALVDYIDNRRTTALGILKAPTLALVRYQPVNGGMQLQRLWDVPPTPAR